MPLGTVHKAHMQKYQDFSPFSLYVCYKTIEKKKTIGVRMHSYFMMDGLFRLPQRFRSPSLDSSPGLQEEKNIFILNIPGATNFVALQAFLMS